MALMSLILGRKKPVKIDVLTLDAAITESHEFNNQVTQFPIENGAVISDHVIEQPEILTIEGFVTNSPVTFLGKIDPFNKGTPIPGTGKRTENALTILLDLHNGKYNVSTKKKDRKLIDIVTGLMVHTDMVFVSLTFPRSATTGDTLAFTAKFQHIQVARSEVSKVPNTKDNVKNQGQNTVPTGPQTAAAATGIEKSWLAAAYDEAKATYKIIVNK